MVLDHFHQGSRHFYHAFISLLSIPKVAIALPFRQRSISFSAKVNEEDVSKGVFVHDLLSRL